MFLSLVTPESKERTKYIDKCVVRYFVSHVQKPNITHHTLQWVFATVLERVYYSSWGYIVVNLSYSLQRAQTHTYAVGEIEDDEYGRRTLRMLTIIWSGLKLKPPVIFYKFSAAANCRWNASHLKSQVNNDPKFCMEVEGLKLFFSWKVCVILS